MLSCHLCLVCGFVIGVLFISYAILYPLLFSHRKGKRLHGYSNYNLMQATKLKVGCISFSPLYCSDC